MSGESQVVNLLTSHVSWAFSENMSINNLHDKKWNKFLSLIWLFQFIPFVDFVLASGSLATGNMREESDFDVIVGVRKGRIFTTRFFCFLIFSILRLWARHPGKSKNRLCFNHFVTPDGYTLKPPYNDYWQTLYSKLVPVYGDPMHIQRFYRANTSWMKAAKLYEKDSRHKFTEKNIFGKILEDLLSGTFGNWLEKELKKIQIEKMESGRNPENEYKPRIIVNDDELEFHPNTKRIEEWSR